MAEKSPATTFHPFNRLPAELRDRIWFFCLPCRVVPLDNILWLLDYGIPDGIEQQCWVDSSLVVRRAKAPPCIAAVCREARQVAFRWGSVERNDTGSLRHVWVQRKLDTLLFAWTEGDSIAAGHSEDMLDLFLSDQRWYHPGAPVCLIAELFHEFYASPSAPRSDYSPLVSKKEQNSIALLLSNAWKEDEPDAEVPDLSDPMDVDVVMETVYIHATRADLLASQLFGRIADEPSQLVDYNDTATLAKYRALFDKNPNNNKRVALIEKLNAIQSPEFPGQVAKWLAKVTWKLLVIKWLFEKRHNPQSSIYDNPMQVFNKHFEDGDSRWIMLRDTSSFNAHHPWVVEETQMLPKLRPKIWFTYCTKDCELRLKPRNKYEST